MDSLLHIVSMLFTLGATSMAVQVPSVVDIGLWRTCLNISGALPTMDHPINGYIFKVTSRGPSLVSQHVDGSLLLGLATTAKEPMEACMEDIISSLPIKIHEQCIQSNTVLILWSDIRAALNMSSFPAVEKYSVCLKTNNESHPWVHVGALATAIFFPTIPPHQSASISTENKRYLVSTPPAPGAAHPFVPKKLSILRQSQTAVPKVLGIRIESGGGKSPYVNEEGVTTIQANQDAMLRLFGWHLTAGLQFKFAFAFESEFNNDVCDQTSSTRVFITEEAPLSGGLSVLLPINLPDMPNPAADYYPCMRVESPDGVAIWIPVGSAPEVQLRTDSQLLPVWAKIVFISILLCLSGLFSGLNLGLMALDKTELKILLNTGSEKEKGYAAKVMPVRRLGNYLLCSLLLGNVLVNSSLTLLLDELTSGLTAIIGSTMGIVIFGEIIPQAICSRHGLAVGAHTVWITKIFMALTFPMAFPISKILDKILGKELGSYYDRERLKELVKVTNEYNDLEKDEVNIISGALDLKKKTVVDVMTKLDDVFMLSYDAVLDFGTMTEIRTYGYSRIPVYDKERPNIVSILYVKDLVLMDPDDDTPLKTLCDFYKNPCFFVHDDTNLDVIFRQFKTGDKGHLAFIQKLVDTGEKDPQYEVIGIVTLEDVIEEIIQAEIVDETDVFTDNRSKKRLRRNEEHHNKSIFMPHMSTRARLSPQLALASLQYLSTCVEAFMPEYIAERILRQLLKQDIFFQIKIPMRNNVYQDDRNLFIYERGKPEDYFVLILEGRVEVIVGNDNMSFESGPFTAFGMKAFGHLLSKDEGAAGEKGVPAQIQIQPQDVEKKLKAKLPNALARIGSIKVTQQPAATSAVAPAGMFVPDYSMKAVTDISYVKIRSVQYAAARRATLLFHKQTQEHSTKSMKQLDRDVEKIWQDVEKAAASASMVPQNYSASSMRSSSFATDDNSQQHVLNEGKLVISKVHQRPSLLTIDNNIDDDEAEADPADQFVMDDQDWTGTDEDQHQQEARSQDIVQDADNGRSLSSTDDPIVEDLEDKQASEGPGGAADDDEHNNQKK